MSPMNSRFKPFTHSLALALALAVALLLPPPAAVAQEDATDSRREPLPLGLEGVGITEHLNEKIPLDLKFVDEDGRDVLLSDYFEGDKPVILTLNYYRCPMLCTLQLNGLIHALQELKWMPGQEFEVVTVSIDPTETPNLALAKKKNYMREYGKAGAGSGWHFLTGKNDNIKPLAEAVGFAYKWNPARKEWAHDAAFFVITPDGVVSRYLYGIEFEPKQVRLALLEASQGKIGTTFDRIILSCYVYDPNAEGYVLQAWSIMRWGGILTVIVLGVVLLAFWIRELRRKRQPALTQEPQS